MAVGKLRYGFHLTNAILTRHCPLRRGQNSIFFIKTFRKLNIIFQKPVHYGLIYTHRISRVWQNLFFQLLVRDWWKKLSSSALRRGYFLQFFAFFWFLKWKFVYILKNCFISFPWLNSLQDNLFLSLEVMVDYCQQYT